MTEYEILKRNKKNDLSKSTRKIIRDLLSALSSAGSKASEIIRNAYEDLPSQKTSDDSSENVYIEKDVLVPPPKSAKGSISTNESSPDIIATESSAPAFKPIYYDATKKTVSAPEAADEAAPALGSNIRERIKSVLNQRADTESPYALRIFDDIDDEAIERNVPVAKETVDNNISRGILPEDAEDKYPYLLDGLTLFYAASEKGNNKAAKKARDAAYTEEDSKRKSPKNDYKAESGPDEFQRTNMTYLNNPEKNNGSIFFDNTKIINKKYQRVYHGDTWLGNPQLDLNCDMLSKDELRKMKWISWADFINSENDHIANWRQLANSTSIGEMQTVVNDMITHFLDGTGTDYSNKTLTKIVREHKNTKSFMHDFTKVFKEFLEKNNGNIKEFANSDAFKKALKTNDVLLSKYAYSGIDTLTGLRMAIHSWTESNVDIETFEVLPDGSYHGRLKFTFIDNFGLNATDIDAFGQYAGFRSWYILQHYNKYNGKYKPFRTIVKIDYPFSGKFYNYTKE